VLPPFAGRPIRVELRPSLGPHLAATHIPRRVILLDAGLLDAGPMEAKLGDQAGEFERILVHEIFHFAWVRLSNQTRRSWEGILAAELAVRARGELGWSAEWRKDKLTRADVRGRRPAWRRYVCESFCDTSAWLCAGLRRHDEFTLGAAPRRIRRRWFVEQLLDGRPVAV
jgi:hypothetical protein